MIKQKNIGMHGMTPRVQIGQFSISMQNSEDAGAGVWIENGNGEGGAFPHALLEEYLEDFFNEYLSKESDADYNKEISSVQ